uniref:SUEL-type lectin domain-containing protein n=1 Tax=Maylandia zebra TaxID=106582 RepID=A0A3P9CZZ2_9CICH
LCLKNFAVWRLCLMSFSMLPLVGFLTALVCQGSAAVLHCPQESVINIRSAFYGRQNADICPHFDGSESVGGILPKYRKMCDNLPFCFAYANVDPDPCPTVSKYLELIYSCEQKGNFSIGEKPENPHW